MDELDCPNCGGEHTLEYHTKEIALSDEIEELALVEGLVCQECGDLFMTSEETARYLNVRAAIEKAGIRFVFFNGTIQQLTVN